MCCGRNIKKSTLKRSKSKLIKNKFLPPSPPYDVQNPQPVENKEVKNANSVMERPVMDGNVKN